MNTAPPPPPPPPPSPAPHSQHHSYHSSRELLLRMNFLHQASVLLANAITPSPTLRQRRKRRRTDGTRRADVDCTEDLRGNDVKDPVHTKLEDGEMRIGAYLPHTRSATPVGADDLIPTQPALADATQDTSAEMATDGLAASPPVSMSPCPATLQHSDDKRSAATPETHARRRQQVCHDTVTQKRGVSRLSAVYASDIRAIARKSVLRM